MAVASTSGSSGNAYVSATLSKLWHNDAAVRLDATAQLVDFLAKTQQQQQDSGSEELSDETSYALRRLVRGLASPRDSSRLGFAVALTELLARLDRIDPRQILTTVLDSSQLANGVKGQEERDLVFSRLFGIHAILSSGLLFRPAATLHDWRTAIEEVWVLGERRAWLRESAGWVVQSATKQLLLQGELSWRQEGVQTVITAAFSPSSESGATSDFTPEKLALVILLQDATIKVEWDKILKPTFPDSALLDTEDNLPAIARLLRGLAASESAKKANEQAQSIFFGNGQLHYVWQTILDAYFGPRRASLPDKPSRKKAKTVELAHPKIPFVALYNASVEEQLLGPTSAVSAKYVGLLAFEACFAAASVEVAPQLVGDNLTRTFVNHLSKGDRTLHSVCQRVTRSLSEVVRAKPSIGLPVLMRLFAGEQGYRFDALTRTKTVEGIVGALDATSAQQYSSWLMAAVVDPLAEASSDGGDAGQMAVDDQADAFEQAKVIEAKRSWAIDQLLLLVRKHSVALPAEAASAQPSWTVDILNFFAVHGFFSVQKASKKASISALHSKPEPALSTLTPSLCASRLFSAISHLVNVNPRCRAQTWTHTVLDTLQSLEKDEKHVSALFNPEDAAARQPVLKALARVKKSGIPQAVPLTFLIEVLLLQSYDTDQDILDPLEQLVDAVDLLVPSSKKGKAAARSEVDDEDGEAAEPVSVLADLLVSLLQRPSVLLRTTVERVFSAFSGEISVQSLQLLLDQITADNSEETDGEASEEAEQDSGGEEAKVNGKSDIGQESEDDSDSDDNEDDEDLDIDLDADPELKAKVEAALRGVGLVGDEDDDEDDGESEGDEDEEDGEELLDDDQMMQLDEQLADIFRAKRATEKGAKAEQEASLNARLKILDLLEIYAKQQAGNSLVVRLIQPLLRIANKSDNEEAEFSAKAVRVLRGIVTKPKEYPSCSSAEVTSLTEVLTAVHALAQRASSAEALALASAASLYLSRLIITVSPQAASGAIIEVYTASWTDYLVRKRSKLQPKFFSDFVHRFRDTAWDLRHSVLQACSQETMTKEKFKRCQAFNVLADLVSAQASLKTQEAKQNIVDFMPGVADVIGAVLAAEASGKGLDFNIARLREVFKACMQLVKATRTAVSREGGPKTWDLWQADKFAATLADLCKSDKVAKGSLNASSKQLLDLILEGSGRAKVKDISTGMPPMQDKAGSSKRKQQAALQNGKEAKSVKRKADEAEIETSSDSS